MKTEFINDITKAMLDASRNPGGRHAVIAPLTPSPIGYQEAQSDIAYGALKYEYDMTAMFGRRAICKPEEVDTLRDVFVRSLIDKVYHEVLRELRELQVLYLESDGTQESRKAIEDQFHKLREMMTL